MNTYTVLLVTSKMPNKFNPYKQSIRQVLLLLYAFYKQGH